MKHFTTVHDVSDIDELVKDALSIKKNPYLDQQLGINKTLGMIFMNPSLRTRISTQKAAENLGMKVISLNINQESWALEFEDGAIMDGSSVEHIKDAAHVLGQYCDVIAIRSFPTLLDKELDYSEKILIQFMKYCKVPVISLESATLHPLQSFADLITIKENWKQQYLPKIVLTWAPHIKALPQAVANSFSEWVLKSGYNLTITNPVGYDLCEDFTSGATISHNQEEALKDADFIYVKNWSSYHDYGKAHQPTENWILNNEKLNLTKNAKIMHCLPVRRNVELLDELIDGNHSLIKHQSENRLYAAQSVLKKILQDNLKYNQTFNTENHEQTLHH